MIVTTQQLDKRDWLKSAVGAQNINKTEQTAVIANKNVKLRSASLLADLRKSLAG